MIALGTSLSLISPGGELLSSVRLRKPVQHHDEVQGSSTILYSSSLLFSSFPFFFSHTTTFAGETVAGGPRVGEIWSVAPPALGDFNNDGLADVLVVAHDGLYGYAIAQGAGSVLFPMLVVALLCVMVYALVRGEVGAGGAGIERMGVRKRALD